MPSNSPQQRLKAHYKTTLGALFSITGGIGLAFSLWSMAQTNPSANYLSSLSALSAVLFLFGLYCLNRPYFLLEPTQLTVYNLLGRVSKRYTFESWAVVKADSRRIYIDDDGITKKVPVSPLLVSTEDWLALREMLRKR